MNINIYQNYKIKVKIDCCYLSEEIQDFSEYKYYYEKNINGYDLLNLIKEKLNDITEFTIKEKEKIIIFDKFNELTGENDKYIIKIEEIE